MLERLVLNNFSTGTSPVILGDDIHFSLKTCQRTLLLSLDDDPICQEQDYEQHMKLTGKDAYLYLLETICGLKSKLVGENEIVGQFKTAFKEFLDKEYKDKELIRILEKLFKDAKEIRTKYLLGLSQKTYASIARKNICNKNKAENVLILGSGSLAEDLINQLKKKANVFISARNEQRLEELCSQHELNVVEWSDFEAISNHAFIANTIGTDNVIFDRDFFKEWSKQHDKKLFIDLGSPTCIEPSKCSESNVMMLEDIFKEGAVHESHKLKQVEKARDAMNVIIEKRNLNLSKRIKQATLANFNESRIKETQLEQ